VHDIINKILKKQDAVLLQGEPRDAFWHH